MLKTELEVAGQLYGGWKTIKIQRGMEQISGAFELGVTQRWTDARVPRRINRGDSCRVLVDGQPVITGYVDDTLPRFSTKERALTVKGRDRTADLVDCSAIYKTGQWAGAKLQRIALDLVAPFGIEVIDRAAVATTFPSYAIQEGETVFETLERAARMRGVLLVSDGQGRLVITRAGTKRIATALVEGKNILAGDGEFSWRNRFSKYIVKGQAQGTDQGFGVDVASQKAEVADPAITRHRPLIVLAEDQGSGSTFKDRALWERNVRMGRGSRASITVQGWKHAGGLWTPNELVRLTSVELDADEDMLVAAVSYQLDEGGERAELELCRPEAFDVIAKPRKKKTVDVWQ